MDPIFPWQQKNWRHLCNYKSQNRIPQALLITGNKGLGKQHLAEQFAFSLLCAKPDPNGLACSRCPSCLLIKAETHPDFIRIQPSEPGKAIGIDLIRALIVDMQLKPQYDAYRVVLISPADQMNRPAANAFLKYLEEPGERTVILLISDKPASMPPTIRSRCQKLAVDTPDKETVFAWLKQQNIKNDLEILTGMAQNSPLLARRYADEKTLSARNECFKAWLEIAGQSADPVMVAESWLALPQSALLFWLSTWIIDLIKCFYRTKPDNFYNPDLFIPLQELAGQLDLIGLFKLYDLLLSSRGRLDTQVNKQLMFEEILIRWSELTRSTMP
jgi:DNA polymerase-3 subunit delta'